MAKSILAVEAVCDDEATCEQFDLVTAMRHGVRDSRATRSD